MGNHVDVVGRLCCVALAVWLLGCDGKGSDSNAIPAPSPGAIRPPIPELTRDVRQVINHLQEMPAWDRPHGPTHDSMCQDDCSDCFWQWSIERHVEEIASYDLETIRAGVKRYLDGERFATGGIDEHSLSRIYVLNQYLFDLPETISWEDYGAFHFVGQWHLGPFLGDDLYNPKASDLLLMRWPWSVNERGQWRLTGRDEWSKSRTGEPYSAMAFDRFTEVFGRREIEAEQE